MAPFGVMLYGSAEVFLVSENILALPSTCLFQSLLSRKTRTTKTCKMKSSWSLRFSFCGLLL